jgi:1-acyl-sn-glycerol-3-phosphate acyltransferase
MSPTWRRRLLTFPALGAITVALWGAAPLWVGAALLWDLTLGRKLAATRTTLMLLLYTLADWVGIAAALLTRAVGAVAGDPGGRRSLTWHRVIKREWNRALARVGFWLFGARLEVEGDRSATGTPFLVFLRHAGIADVLIAPIVFELPHPTFLRYAVKRELLWDPAFDLVGPQVRAVFVDRDSTDGAGERARVAQMIDGLEPDEGVLLYPEGTRFSTRKAEAIQAKLKASGDDDALTYARSLTRVLPPKLGGTLALLQRNPGHDVVFCAHTGLDRAYSVGGMLRGDLVGLVVRVKLWRVPFAEIPREPDAQAAWMRSQWARMDREVAALEARARGAA